MLQTWKLKPREESDLPNITQSLMQKEETDTTSPYWQVLFPPISQCFSLKAQKETECEGMVYHVCI